MHAALASLQDYVVDKWDEVSVSDEFEQCCQEVASGEYVVHVEFRELLLIECLQVGT